MTEVQKAIREADEEEAAVTIQKNWRGKKTRLELADKKQAQVEKAKYKELLEEDQLRLKKDQEKLEKMKEERQERVAMRPKDKEEVKKVS
jgi:hypothetical protein